MLHQPFMIPAALLGLFSLPLALRLVPRNRFYGIRTARTMADEAIWYAANRLAGWLLLVASLISLLFSLVRPMTGGHDPDPGLWLAHFTAFLSPLAISLWVVRRYLRQLGG